MKNQIAICEKFDSPIEMPQGNKKIGIAISSMNQQPIRGRRYLPTVDTEGWYIWGGEFSSEDDFFQPLHSSHVADMFPSIEKYLALSPGFSFVIDNAGYEDVWFDDEQSKKFNE